MLQNHLRKLIEITKVESFFLNWVFSSNRQFFKFFVLVILMIFGELLLYASDGEIQSDEKPLSANLSAESLEKEEAGDIPPLIKREDKIIEQEEDDQAAVNISSVMSSNFTEGVGRTSSLLKKSQDDEVIEQEGKSVKVDSEHDQLLINIEMIRRFISFVNIWIWEDHGQKCFESKFLEEIDKNAIEISEIRRIRGSLTSQELASFGLSVAESLRKFERKNQELLKRFTREGAGRSIDEQEIHSIPQRLASLIGLFEPQITQDPYGCLLLSFYEVEDFIRFIKSWDYEEGNEKYFESKPLERIEAATREMIEPLRRGVGHNSGETVIYYEIAKFSSYVLSQLEQFRQRNQGKLNRLTRESTNRREDNSGIHASFQRLSFVVSKYTFLKSNAEIIIQEKLHLNSKKLKEIKDKLTFDDSCQISIMLYSNIPHIFLGVKNIEKGINARIFMEMGALPFPAKKEATLLSYINPLAYLPRRGGSSTYNIGCLTISTNPDDFLAVAEESLRPWVVKSSYVAMALDKMIADSRESKKCIENLDDYSEEYTNDRYFFSQLLKDFLQIRPTDPIPELRSRCSSNEEIKRYFFGKAKYLPGYRPPNSIF